VIGVLKIAWCIIRFVCFERYTTLTNRLWSLKQKCIAVKYWSLWNIL